MTLVTLTLAESSTTALRRFLQENKLPDKDAFHTTIVYSKVIPLYENQSVLAAIGNASPLRIEPPYVFDIFGASALVLRFESAQFTDLQNELVRAAIKEFCSPFPSRRKLEVLRRHAAVRTAPVYPGHPHITIAKDYAGDPFALPSFTQKLYCDGFRFRQP